MSPFPVQLADVFGLLLQCKDTMGDEALLAQAMHTLRQAVHPEEPPYTSCWNFSTEEYVEVCIFSYYMLQIMFMIIAIVTLR